MNRRPGGLAALLPAAYALAALLVCARLLAGPVGRVAAGQLPGVGGDFLALSVGGYLVRSGQGAELYDAAAQARSQEAVTAGAEFPGDTSVPALYVYPPFVAAFFALLAGLPRFTAYMVWAGTNLLALALAAWGIGRTVGEQRLDAPGKAGFYAGSALAALTFLPAWLALLRGQVTYVVMAALAGCYVALAKRRDLAAGLCLALALVKPQLAVVPLLALLAARRPRAVLGFALGAAALAAVAAVVAGPAGLAGYARLLLQVGSDTGVNSAVHTAYMYNWRGTAVRLLELATGGPAPAGPVLGIYAALSIATLVPLARAWRAAPHDHPRRLAGLWALTILAGMLVSPHLHGYDTALWLAAGAPAAVYFGWGTGSARGLNKRRPAGRQWAVLMAAHVLPLLSLALDAAWAAQVGTFATAALAGTMCYAIGHEKRREAA